MQFPSCSMKLIAASGARYEKAPSPVTFNGRMTIHCGSSSKAERISGIDSGVKIGASRVHGVPLGQQHLICASSVAKIIEA